MLIEYIERLRKEPPEVRRRAVFFWSAIVVGGIVFLYLVYLGIDFSTSSGSKGVSSGSIARPYGD